MTHDLFSIRVRVVAIADVIEFTSGNTLRVPFKITGTDTLPKSYNLCCVEKIGKSLGKKLFVELFKDNFFNDNYVIVNFVGRIHLEIKSPDHKILIKEKNMKINKYNFPKSIIRDFSNKFANITIDNKDQIIGLMELIATISGISPDISESLISPLINMTDVSIVKNLYNDIINSNAYTDLVNNYIFNGGGITQIIKTFINAYNNMSTSDDPFTSDPFPTTSTKHIQVNSKIAGIPLFLELFLILINLITYKHMIKSQPY